MSDKKVFISGSISIKSLNDDIIESIKNIVAKNYKILVGDAPGIDTMVQNLLVNLDYSNVEVYSIFSTPRYKASIKFKNKYINVSTEIKKERERQTYKDKAMSEDSDFSFVIWDGKSKGSFANILRAIETNKFVKIFYTEEGNFLDNTKITKEEVEFIYRTHNGYTASEIIDYLKSIGIETFKKTQELNKYLLENNIIKKEDKIYHPFEKYEDLFIIEQYKGKVKGVKFKNEFITWIEENIVKKPIQGELF